MYKRLVGLLYWMNLAFQSLFCLIAPIAVMTGISYLLARFAGVGEWIYVVLIVLGALSGMISMIRFILTVSENIRRFEEAGEPEHTPKERRSQREENESRHPSDTRGHDR